MGMDLIPLNPAAAGWHTNWTGWRFIRQTLELLGADTAAMSGSNDGNVIDEDTALDWAARLDEALEEGRLKITEVPDSSFFGGISNAPSLDCGVPARQTREAPWLRDAIDFFGRCSGFQQF